MSVTESARAGQRTTMPWPALLTLAAAVFLSITLELLPTGLLPEMAAGLGVGESAIGLTVSVFALTVVLTSAPLVALTARVPRRLLLVIVLTVLAVSTIATALAPTYWLLVAVRFAGGLAHGVFWSIVAAEASRLVPDRLIARAVAIVIGGGTLAIVLGVPGATVLGQAFGWRVAFAVVGGLTLAGALAVRVALPKRAGSGAAAADVSQRGDRADASTAPSTSTDATAATAPHPTAARFRRNDPALGAVLVVCAVTALTMLGQYAVFTYIAPILTDLIGVGASAVGPLLFVYGAAGAVGLVISGSPLARRATAALLVSMAVIAVALAAIALVPTQAAGIAALAAWGLAFGALPALLQVRLLRAAPASHRDAASALYTTGFNAGIGGGALIGAVVFDRVGVGALPWVYVVLLVAAAMVLVIGRRLGGSSR
ncbi:MFS transporter [Agromyces intestinalis]|uniref:MFS transporter n=1 Tax=Agromyces intestinalis TaxID=2592652 RepID=A0A5C1YIB8_9MICO|nr:MFS transporter [Agromyces intestinalis]QEO15265.1 MFS transporter [Agromyces intestinalis]